MSITYSSLLIFCTTWSIIGFPVLAALTSFLGVSSTEFSIALRTLAAAFSVILLLKWKRGSNDFAVLLFSIFWIAYFVRLYLSTLLDLEDLRRPEQFYWIWAFGACFLPTLAVLAHQNSDIFENIYCWLVLLSVVAVMVSLGTGDTLVQGLDGHVYDINRLNLGSLNPISLGHLGVTCALLGICGFVSRKFKNRHFWMPASAIALGLTVVILANSRGPIVAFCICVLFLILGGARRLGAYVVVGTLLGFAVLVYVFQVGAVFSATGVLARFSGVVSVDAAVGGRIIALQGAVEQFLGSPIFGDAIEEKTTGFYPHNVLVEAFMATGFVGGIPFLTFILLAMLRSWRMVRSGSEDLWVGLLAMQYFLAAMTSGAIYSVHGMWVLLALAICTKSSRKINSSYRA